MHIRNTADRMTMGLSPAPRISACLLSSRPSTLLRKIYQLIWAAAGPRLTAGYEELERTCVLPPRTNERSVFCNSACKETLSSGEHSDALTEKQNMVTRGSSAPTPRTNERSAFCSSACKEMLSPADTRTP